MTQWYISHATTFLSGQTCARHFGGLRPASFSPRTMLGPKDWANFIRCLCVLFGVLLVAGCKKQEAAPPPPERPSTSIADLVEKKAEPPDAGAPTTPPAQQAEPEAHASPDGLPTSQRLYEGIQKYLAEHQGRGAKGIDRW